MPTSSDSTSSFATYVGANITPVLSAAVVELLKEVEQKTNKLPKPNIEDTVEIQSIPLKLYINEQVAPVLAKALAACYQKQPADPIEFVANYLFTDCPAVSPAEEEKMTMIHPVHWLSQYLLRTTGSGDATPVYTDAPQTMAFTWEEMSKDESIHFGVSVLDATFDQLSVFPTVFKKGMTLGGQKMVVKLQISSFTKFADIVWSAYEPITSKIYFVGSRHRNISHFLSSIKGGPGIQLLTGEAEKIATRQAMCLSLRKNKDGKEELILAESSFIQTRLRAVFDHCETDADKRVSKRDLIGFLTNVEQQSKFMIAHSGNDPSTWLEALLTLLRANPSGRLSFDAFIAHLTQTTIKATPSEPDHIQTVTAGATVVHDSMSKVCDTLYEVKVYSNGVVHISDSTRGESYVGNTSGALPTEDATAMISLFDRIVILK